MRAAQAAKENLDQFAKALRLKSQKFEIDGHTDATGAEQYNLGLGAARRRSVSLQIAPLRQKPLDRKWSPSCNTRPERGRSVT
jgi:hypothetical protein